MAVDQHSSRSSSQSSHQGSEPTPDQVGSVQLCASRIIEILQRGQIEEQGLLPYSSNYSFLITVTHDGVTLPAVYKPRRGENPLWDFESGTLCQREVAAYLVSNALGWELVPPTVLRRGKHGVGSVQFFINHDGDQHYFTFQSDARFAPALRQLALFDFVVNNADRKGGHCLIGDDGRLWAIDHGICFHCDYKLRTVIWEFSEEPIEDHLYADLCTLQKRLVDVNDALHTGLCQLINPRERQALQERLSLLVRHREYPAPKPHIRNYPWPPV